MVCRNQTPAFKYTFCPGLLLEIKGPLFRVIQTIQTSSHVCIELPQPLASGRQQH
jgi:hypothetical protein